MMVKNSTTPKSPTSAANAKSAMNPAASQALRSMTGYAQARTVESGWSLRVTLRSVNHRFLDLHVRMPEGFEPIEPRIRQMVREGVRRGHVDVTVNYELAGPAAVGVNQEVAAAYIEAANALRKKFKIQAEPDLAAILRLPGVIGPPGASLEEEIARLEEAVARCLGDSLERLNEMREREAGHLREEMEGRLRTIATLAQQAGVLAEGARPAFARRL
ncbi:MAG: YicC/YloC family endoribonuclease, partial [Candidatus Acidiferrales bacterium]